ncbi:MAG TPA: VOC family protein [Thermoanaerobaculia bacterium]|nr:VOC family protein [Thermoanaerobaculia bacterium]
MQINPYLNFNGQCAEAFRFYEQVLGGKIEMMMTMGESPMAGETPPEMLDRVMHVSMTVGGQSLMGSDSPPEMYQKPQGLHVSLHYDTAEEGGRVFNALAEGGTVVMPFEKTFWAEGFGMLVDRFGTPWMVNCGGGNSQA